MARMDAICEAAKVALLPVATPYFHIHTDDGLCSTVDVAGSFDPKETWINGIRENSRDFRFAIQPKGRYYTDGDIVVVTLDSASFKIPVKFRKYTGTPDKCIAKIKEWIEKVKAS
jgi:hypothetical protein